MGNNSTGKNAAIHIKAETPKSFLSRYRIPLEAAAALLLFASVYWYQRTPPPAAPPTSISASQAPNVASPSGMSADASGVSRPGPKQPKEDVALPRRAAPPVKDLPPRIAVSRAKPETAGEKTPAAGPTAKPRTWTAADLPAVPAFRASTDSERIVPVAPAPGPTAEGAAGAEAPSFGTMRSGEADGSADSLKSRVFAAPPSRLLRPLPYGRDVVLDVGPDRRDGAEDRIAAAALRLGGFVERIELRRGPGLEEATGTVRVVLPEAAAPRFLEELDRIGTIPPEGKPAAIDLPAGPRAGTVAYAVRIRVR